MSKILKSETFMSIVTRETHNISHQINFDDGCFIFCNGNYLDAFSLQDIMTFMKMFQSYQSSYPWRESATGWAPWNSSTLAQRILKTFLTAKFILRFFYIILFSCFISKISHLNDMHIIHCLDFSRKVGEIN